MKKISKILEKISLCLLLLSVGSLVITNMATRVPTIFGYRLFFVFTDSMEPTFTRGAVLIAVPVKDENLNVNEIYAYRVGQNDNGFNSIVVHRLVDINEKNYIFKGDNNIVLDKTVRREQVLYRIIYPKQERNNKNNY